MGKKEEPVRARRGQAQAPPEPTRRRFLEGLGAALAAALAARAQVASSEGRDLGRLSEDALPPPPPRSAQDEAVFESQLLRMQAELRRALAKPVEERRWVMVIDLRKCVGCHACTISCKAENRLPPGVVYRPVIEEELGEFPHVGRRFLPRPCMHCDHPPCVPVCPVAATYKRPDGIVAIDYDVCIGCRYCITACPYNARTFDFGDSYNFLGGLEADADQAGFFAKAPYEQEPSFEYGRSWPRRAHRSPIGNARKCHFCLHRLAEGMLPACTTTCVGGATYFGDANDPHSLVRELISLPNVMRLKEELGTEPRVYYLL